LYSGERRSFKEAIFFAFACLRLLRFDFDALEADAFPYVQIFMLRLVTWLKRKPLSVTWHEVWSMAYWREYVGLAGYVAWLVDRVAMRLPEHLIAASPETGERLRAILGPRASIVVAPNGIDFDVVRSSYPDSARTDIVTVGRLIEHKNVGMLVDAVALLHAEGVPVTCRIIGDGPQRAQLLEQARALGIHEAIDFRHDVSEQKDVYSLLKAASVAVFPSAREGFGIAVLEALACGTPVVTTSAPDNLAQHLVARSVRGAVCEPSVAAIAAAVRRTLAESGGQSQEGQGHAEAWLEQYSWDAVTEQIARVLEI
jgi:glycosyltransferase involved in cell wall biosynthesis